jgi:hypothetical protein
MRIAIAGLLALLLASVSAPASTAEPVRVLFVGNSLTYVNDLPRLTRALADSQPGGPAIETSAWVEPGGSVEARWRDGHAAESLRSGDWDVLVLQERSNLLACMGGTTMPREPECRRSASAHARFAELAAEHGTRVLLLSTWAEDGKGQERLDRGIANLAGRLEGDVAIVPTGRILRRWADLQPEDAPAFPDGGHPSFAASLVIAATLYESIAGTAPVAADMLVDFPLLVPRLHISPGKPLETHDGLGVPARPFRLTAAAVAPYLEAASALR